MDVRAPYAAGLSCCSPSRRRRGRRWRRRTLPPATSADDIQAVSIDDDPTIVKRLVEEIVARLTA
jgi:hypothetical protein